MDIEKIKAFRRLYVATDQQMSGVEETGNGGPFDDLMSELEIRMRGLTK
ncbi:hypothetical protein Niako_2760 [Niastella koreensis GR20-10]|uniref:Uncharacterized protein n=1 Tax=Niastella koreensis (strain DSM 17620 / KACC 11465 / NBRC 106392 / GR20-10) TaxID=700598 RepID=G8T8C5_NIAKG|nr:hypothetical protein [Niastella koreensis]AEV99095.1 hypothetical protein Niako_2760 [Niastella koreensis GR20-10]